MASGFYLYISGQFLYDSYDGIIGNILSHFLLLAEIVQQEDVGRSGGKNCKSYAGFPHASHAVHNLTSLSSPPFHNHRTI